MKNLSDEELIAHLRLQGLDKDIAAADRIEHLLEGNKGLAEAFATVSVKREMAEAKLAKAVEALRNRMHCHDCSCGECDHIREVLAELEKDT